MYTFMFYSVSNMEIVMIIANSVMQAHYIFGSELVKKFNNGDNDYKIVGSVDHSITNDIFIIDSTDLND